MQRKNGVEVEVEAPDVGLVTVVPSNLPDKKKNRAIVVAKNIRADGGVLRNAPGYEKIVPKKENLKTPANLIFQAEIRNGDREIATTPIIGTRDKLFVVTRRTRPLVCTPKCQLTAWVVGDTGRSKLNEGETVAPASEVADLIKDTFPGLVVHVGDMVYATGGVSPVTPDYEELVAQFYHWAIGHYDGMYGKGPGENKFFPVLGNHDWDDATIEEYYEFFTLPNNERYYTYKRGPVQFFHFSGDTEEPDGVAEDSDQGEWLASAIAASDCPWRFVVVHFPPYTSDSLHYPGRTDLRWLCDLEGVSAILSGHGHNAELVEIEGKAPVFISGNGGKDLRGFNDPVVEGSVFRYNADYGALRVDADFDNATFRFYNRAGDVLHTKVLSTPALNGSVCYIGDAAKTVTSLKVIPSSATVEVGSSWPFRAVAYFVDGTTDDVTDRSVWTSSNDSVASVGTQTGVATGVKHGTVNIQASFGGQTASGSLTVLLACTDAPADIVFVLDRSLSMSASSSGQSRLDAARYAIKRMLEQMSDSDQVGLVSFAGTFATQTEDATIDSVLTSYFPSVERRLDLLVADGATSTAAALEAAHSELESDRVAAGSSKMIILITDGAADVVNPGGNSSSQSAGEAAAMAATTTAANAIKADGITLVTIAYHMRQSDKATVASWATSGYAWECESAEDLADTLGKIPNILCVYDGYYYYATDDTCASPVLDYKNWTNWDVVSGTVDLCGEGGNGVRLWDLHPGNGLYADLRGTNPLNATGEPSNDGVLQTKTSFSFVSGKTYRVSFKLGGNRRQDIQNMQIRVKVGTLLNQLIVIDNWQQQFLTYTFTFTPGTNISSKVRIEQLPGPLGVFSNVGTYFDDFKLENVTDNTVLLMDDFDSENPCPP